MRLAIAIALLLPASDAWAWKHSGHVWHDEDRPLSYCLASPECGPDLPRTG